MYTKEDYLAEKNAMTKQERMVQERFEQIINILILYKQENRDKTVYLSEKSMNEALQWFQSSMNSVIETIQN
tara:strand:- start:407 stop:622 length:216 start_codon:yes stop_codon:yes gene_type:complete